MRRPEPAERVLRMIFPDRTTKALDAIIGYAYDRYDGEHVGRCPKMWEWIGDRTDDLRVLWHKRPVRG